MDAFTLITAYALISKKEPAPQKKPGSQAHSDPESREEELWIVCRQCRQRLTRPSERTSINGSHRHTFANPSGVVF